MIRPGSKLAHYEVVSALGKGGMGEVWRAKDTKLGRQVAIKTLPAEFAQDADRLARFEREAKLLALLNHPNIATIYGLEEHEGLRFLVLELVEGDTLADRLKRGAIPVEESLKLALQIAGALEAAHEKGVIHRDLKPANIKVTSDDTVKVLDFGLAKAIEGHREGHSPSSAPTVSTHATQRGVVLGTAAYMSPEQARGQSVDARTDVWAFGCVLYEMLTGHPAFRRETYQDTLAAVLNATPDWDALPNEVPARVTLLLRRSLAASPKRRLRDIGDALLELQEDSEHPVQLETSAVRLWQRARVALALAAVGLAVIIMQMVWMSGRTEPGQPLPVTRTLISVPSSDQLSAPPAAIGSRIALSHDGRTLVYVASRDGVDQLFVRALDQLDVRPLSNTEGVSEVFLSPDGEWVGFIAGNALKKVRLEGGPSQTLHEMETAPHGATWGPDDSIVFGRHNSSIWRIPALGGTPTRVTSLEAGDLDHANPHVLPGGEALMFRVQPVSGEPNYIVVEELDTGERHRLVDGSRSWYLANNYVAFALAIGGPLWAVPFDLDGLSFVGEPVPVVEDVARGWFAVSDSGLVVYASPQEVGSKELVWVDRQGEPSPIAVPADNYVFPALSPDANELAVSTVETIWVIDLDRGSQHRLTLSGRDHSEPVWTPDGSRVTFGFRPQDSARAVYSTRADGGGELELIVESGEDLPYAGSWSPSGQLFAYLKQDPETLLDIWILDKDDPDATSVLVGTSAREGAPRFSPDGRWLAYVSDESGRDEVYVRPYPGPGNRVTVSTGGGSEPVWSRNGGELFYRSGNQMMVTTVVTGERFVAEPPQVLFDRPYDFDSSGSRRHANYDTSLDGEHFVMVRSAERDLGQLIFLQNWFTELERLLPSR